MTKYKTLGMLAGKRSKLPILNTVLVQNGMVTATDLDIQITDLAPDGLASGLYIGKGFKDGLYVSCPYDMGDFPEPMETGDEYKELSLSAAFVNEDMAWVALAQSHEEVRYYLNGIFFTENKIVATDGHRLHMASIAAPWPIKKGVIVPRTAIKYLIAMTKEKKPHMINFVFYANHIAFKFGNVEILSKLIDGTYPDYKRAIPGDTGEISTYFNPDEFKKHYKECKILSKYKSIKIIIGNGSFRLEENDKTWPCSMNIPGEGIAFNMDYLLDLKAGTLTYKDKHAPVKITSSNHTGILMPMRF